MIDEPEGDSDKFPDSKISPYSGARVGLLWDTEVEALKPLLRLIMGGGDQLLNDWYGAYTAYFGRASSLSRPDFLAIFKPYLSEALSALAAGQMIDYQALIGQLGEVLAERKVPFAEVLLSLYLCEESAFKGFPESLRTLESFRIFNKLSHTRLAVLAESYFRAWSVQGGYRVADRDRGPSGDAGGLDAIVGASPAIRKLHEHIKAAAQGRGTVLLVGESGSGKELVASAIHQSSPTPDAPFIAVNCAAIPRDLIESELFGYQRGAFSGANSHFLGLFRSAEKGTLFLDEVTEMSPETQSKVLRAIQERTVRPLGSTKEISIDVRLIASTNRDPEEAVRSGQLRQDLYYRLQASVLRVPPLRERREDIPLLVEHFIKLLNSRMGRPVPVEGIEDEALGAMLDYPWPGNVRELSNAIETAMTFGRLAFIGIEDLPPAVVHRNGSDTASHADGEHPQRGPEPDAVSQFTTFQASERELVIRALAITGGNKARAARMLQISRKKLYSLTHKYLPAARSASKS